jgi:hypothetical protein
MTPDVLDALRVCAGLALLGLVIWAPTYLLTDYITARDGKTPTERTDR